MPFFVASVCSRSHNVYTLVSSFVQVAFAGCTACVAHVGTEGIHVANAGDCRAVLGVHEKDGSWSALPLSQDHNSQNQAEMERIKAQHPPSERDTVVTDDRLLGVRVLHGIMLNGHCTVS